MKLKFSYLFALLALLPLISQATIMGVKVITIKNIGNIPFKMGRWDVNPGEETKRNSFGSLSIDGKSFPLDAKTTAIEVRKFSSDRGMQLQIIEQPSGQQQRINLSEPSTTPRFV